METDPVVLVAAVELSAEPDPVVFTIGMTQMVELDPEVELSTGHVALVLLSVVLQTIGMIG
jgi:hypothetical protein